MKHLILAIALCAAASVPAAAQLPKYGKVIVKRDKDVDFTAFRTYSWTKTLPSVSTAIDTAIMTAVDREMAGLGLTIATEGPGDVLVTYTSMSRTDVDFDFDGEDENDLGVPNTVGTLVVSFLDPKDFHYILRLRIDQEISTDPAALEASINRAVPALFVKYPTRYLK